MNKKLILVVFCLVTIGLSCRQKQPAKISSNQKANKIDSLINLYTDYEGFNGSVLVAHEGQIILNKGYGLANRSWNIPNASDTKFQIASLTKPFTATLVMQLVAEGKLELHKPLSNYLPEYPINTKDTITIHQLLTHSSGLSRDFTNSSNSNQSKDIVQDIMAMPLEFQPGQKFAYSNSGYDILGFLVETVTGLTYEEALQERIFKPLGMENSGFFRNRPIIKNMASGYYKGFGDYFNIELSDESTAYASGALYSTVDDLYLFNKALASYTLLPKKYTALLFEKHIEDPGYGGYYGYGWELVDKPIGNSGKLIETVGHSGAIDGFCALYTSIPESNTAIIFLNNTRRAFLNSMTTAITGILYDETYDFPKMPIAKFLTQTIEKDGIEAGISFFKTNQNNTDYYLSERELIVAGYRFLENGQASIAAKIFELSIDAFPDKDNPYDSYAEALMTLGRNDEAIANYKKSLELNPNNRNAVAMLKKLESL